jgi:hypothetical protein
LDELALRRRPVAGWGNGVRLGSCNWRLRALGSRGVAVLDSRAFDHGRNGGAIGAGRAGLLRRVAKRHGHRGWRLFVLGHRNGGRHRCGRGSHGWNLWLGIGVRVSRRRAWLFGSGERAAEVAKSLSKRPPHLRKALRTQNKERDDQDEDQVRRLKNVSYHELTD